MINFAIKSLYLVVPFGIAAIGLASPANAFHGPERSANAAASASEVSNHSGAPVAAPKNAAAKVCIALPALTGSRMPSRQCKTKAQWEALGYELGEKK